MLFGVRVARADLGYNLRDPWWGVPRMGIFHIAEDLDKLREVNVGFQSTQER